MSDNTIQRKSTYTPASSYGAKTDASPEVETSKSATADGSTQSKASPTSSYFSDQIDSSEPNENSAFFEQHASSQTTTRAPSADRESLSIHDIQAQQTAPRKEVDKTALNQSLEGLTQALSRPGVFDAQTLQGSGLNTQLNVSFFDAMSADKLAGALKDMLDDPKATRSAILSGISHLPASDRAEAADLIMESMKRKLGGMIQHDMQQTVNSQVNQAQAKIAPFCNDADPSCRMNLALTFATAEPAQSEAEMAKGLQKIGISADDAQEIAESIVSLRQDQDAMTTLEASINSGDYTSGEHWEDNYIRSDGVLKALDDQIEKAFDSSHDNMQSVKTQLSGDRNRANKAMTNPLFKQAFDQACEKYGIDVSKHSKSNAGRVVHEMVVDQTKSDKREAELCKGVMFLASMAIPGSGIVGAVIVGAVGSVPGVAIAQDDLDVARGGATAGTNSEELVEKREVDRDAEVASAAASVLLGAATSGGLDVEGVSRGASDSILEQGFREGADREVVGSMVKDATLSSIVEEQNHEFKEKGYASEKKP